MPLVFTLILVATIAFIMYHIIQGTSPETTMGQLFDRSKRTYMRYCWSSVYNCFEVEYITANGHMGEERVKNFKQIGLTAEEALKAKNSAYTWYDINTKKS